AWEAPERLAQSRQGWSVPKDASRSKTNCTGLSGSSQITLAYQSSRGPVQPAPGSGTTEAASPGVRQQSGTPGEWPSPPIEGRWYKSAGNRRNSPEVARLPPGDGRRGT